MIDVIRVRHGGTGSASGDPAGTALALEVARALHGTAARAPEITAPAPAARKTAAGKAGSGKTAAGKSGTGKTAARNKARRDAARDRRRAVRG
ncbi:hypothetical protein ACFVT5_12590 [Streptomyces sp. NPDC058001]|uniref:hypothetical protein n=1 Tax=Streptomyces sp. NPDC058001 TaxID=3346300 RepID=UPI0036E97AE0